MDNEEKAKRYDWLTNQSNQIQNQINQIEKRPLEETLQDLNSVEYSVENQLKVDNYNKQLLMITKEFKTLMTGL